MGNSARAEPAHRDQPLAGGSHTARAGGGRGACDRLDRRSPPPSPRGERERARRQGLARRAPASRAARGRPPRALAHGAPGLAAGRGRGDRLAHRRRRARVLLHRPAGDVAAVLGSPLSHEETVLGAEARIKELGITLPQPPKPKGNYVPGVRTGNPLFLSAHAPLPTERNPPPPPKAGPAL